ncbi:MAG: hypothetical protein Q4A79_01280 [Candidatus Saccharibacteria bacterium]|nr:hypothetical protein [Candidatus Saccharibacteria bacterium]
MENIIIGGQLGCVMLEKMSFLACSFVMGLFLGSSQLMASDSVKVEGLDWGTLPEKVRQIEAKSRDEASPSVAISINNTNSAKANASRNQTSLSSEDARAKSSVAPASNQSLARDYIRILGRVIEIVKVSSTGVDAGGRANKFGDKLLYGHNSSTVFGGLSNMGAGSVFSIVEGGVEKNYQVQHVVVYEKVGAETLRLDGKEIMMSVIAKARYAGAYYDLAIMTCTGEMRGNDASHRLVIFANRI